MTSTVKDTKHFIIMKIQGVAYKSEKNLSQRAVAYSLAKLLI